MESSDSRHILSKNIRCVGTRMQQPPLKPEKNRHNTKPKVSCYTSLVFIYLVAAILGDHHNEMVAMLMGIEFFSHAKTIFCSKKFA